jgi:hypothetical protein
MAAVLLGASLAACYDSKKIVFRGEADAGGAGGAPPAQQSRATAAQPAAAPAAGSEREAAAGLVEAMTLGADELAPLDAGIATGAADAAAPDAAP